jgi:hypothetical protein
MSILSYYRKPKMVYCKRLHLYSSPTPPPSYILQYTVDPQDPDLTDVVLHLTDEDLMSEVHRWLAVSEPRVTVNIMIGHQTFDEVATKGEFFWGILCLLTANPKKVRLINSLSTLANEQ